MTGSFGIESPAAQSAFIVDIEGYEGPLDVLLAMAREQKVDLRNLSITRLAEQYLAFVAEARRADLELAAEYLVMAAWLAFLKSRLLLPDPPGAEEPSGEEMAAALRFQLQRLEAMRGAGETLLGGRRLGRDVFARGAPERFEPDTMVVTQITLYDLLTAYGAHLARKTPAVLRIDATELVTVEQAIELLRGALGRLANWESLWTFLPPGTLEGLAKGRMSARSAFAATLAASLELAREGELSIQQTKPFGTIHLGPGRTRDDAT